MSKALIIAEKPSVAADIAKALGGFSKSDNVYERDDLVISSAVGHLVELEVLEANEAGRGLESLPVIPQRFGLKVIDRTRETYRVLERLLRRSDIDGVINACDAGREGELIFRLIYEMAGCRKPIRRMWFQSMTPESLRQAYSDLIPGADKERLYDAAKSRSEADWLIGINGSRGLTSLHQHQTGAYEGMNAGRVQTPTCAIVVDRENQIRTFVSEDFWEVVGTFGVSSGKYKGKWSRAKSAEGEGTESGDASRFFDQSQALALVQECTGKPVDSVHDDVTEGHQVPPRLFDLTTLQREANRRFKMPVKRVLDIAQRLYETHKMTTYPRTDSSALPEDYLDEVSRIIGALENSEWGRYAKQVTDAQWVRPNKRIFDNSKISDHFAIIPTGVMSDALDPDERRIYDLIVRRFLSAFFPDLEFRKTRRVTVVAGQSFRTNGKVVTHQGWRAVLQDVAEEGEPKEDDEAGLCAIQDGEMPVNNGVVAVGGKTTPPARFTEGTLLAAMETAGNQVEDAELRAAMQDKGLGTPATRAATIEKLLEDRDAKKPYLVREKNFLVPTPKAMKLIAFLRSCEAGFLASPQTTGEWEEKLNRMARGEYSRDAFMDEIKETTRHLIDLLRNEAAKAPKVEATVQTLVGKCPDGGGQGGAKPPPLNRLACMCPKCESVMASRDKLVECTSCDFKVWREAFGRKFKDAELDKLIYRGEIKTLNGFVSRNYGNVYSAGVKLDRVSGKMELVFKER